MNRNSIYWHRLRPERAHKINTDWRKYKVSTSKLLDIHSNGDMRTKLHVTKLHPTVEQSATSQSVHQD
ncbi:Uncharacterized protein HZ326_7671 [Fusarium oxysporum f. sp. albedinis]|nr:Uncharacterized protein HZ326_7671 [Fusarium oxysporum f. sp. albedinis]